MFKIPAETTPALWGAAGGAIALAIVGFGFFGWVTHTTAERQAGQRANQAVVTALAPICADRFRQNVNATDNLAELKKIDSWRQGAFIEKGGWSTMGSNTSNGSDVAEACAKLLDTPKS